MLNIRRQKELGLLVVVGGPGGSGSTTIAKLFARKWYLHRLYGGELIRNKAGTKDPEQFIKEDLPKNPNIDLEVDKYLMKMSFQKNILIESKIFAALATINHLPTTIKIWLHADIETSVKRIFNRENWSYDKTLFEKEILKLTQRRQNDVNRFKNIYDVDLDKPTKYNDIVIDSSKLDIYNTTKLIIDKIKLDDYLKPQFPPEYLKY